jgi:hypothetical protein
MSLTIKRNSPSVSQRTKPGQRERERERENCMRKQKTRMTLLLEFVDKDEQQCSWTDVKLFGPNSGD